jgi:hypothetical protein
LLSSPGRRCGAGAGDGGGIFATATGSMATRTCFPAPFRGICELVGSGARESGGSKRPEKSQNLLCCASCCASCCADCGWGAAGVVLGRACGMGGLRHAWPFAALTAAGGGDSVGVRPGWTHTHNAWPSLPSVLRCARHAGLCKRCSVLEVPDKPPTLAQLL